MVTAYVLVRVKPGQDREVLQIIQKLPQVKDVVTVYGEYDLIVKIEVADLQKLDVFIFDTVRTLSGVEVTTTLLATRT